MIFLPKYQQSKGNYLAAQSRDKIARTHEDSASNLLHGGDPEKTWGEEREEGRGENGSAKPCLLRFL